MIYLVESAKAKLKISERHLRRLAARIGKHPSRIGTRDRLLFTDGDLAAIRKLKRQETQHRKAGPRLPVLKIA